MRLADFIRDNRDRILATWEMFAASCLPAARHMSTLELRDHAAQILTAIVADLSTFQTAAAQTLKSQGLAPEPFPARETAAQTHAVLRAKSGFDIKQLASEYRALRASVLALWLEACPPGKVPLDDVIRFNEAIDQALAESITYFSTQVEQSRNLLLGMLSHDMRSPLQTIQTTALYLARLNAGTEVSDAARRLINGGTRMQSLLDDLLDFNRTNLGLGISVTPSDVDVGALCAEELEQIRGAHPECRIQFDVVGDCRGHWDGKRLQQVLDNLVVNALRYGAREGMVRVKVVGEEKDVRIEVANSSAGEPATLADAFEPLKRGSDVEDDLGLGLGLYIVREIAKAHGGSAEGRSDASETVFIVRLPRRAGAS